MYILACALSLMPCILLFLYLRRQKKDEPLYKKLCNKALLRGVISVIPIAVLSCIFNIVIKAAVAKNDNAILYSFLYTVVVLAFVEELVKFFSTKKFIKKNDYAYSWVDVTVFTTIVAIGFSLIETVTLGIGESIPVVLIRAISFPHVGYGFIVGYFLGKSMKLNKPAMQAAGFVVALIIHGAYDFSLQEDVLMINDILVFLPFILTVVDIILVVVLIKFIRKSKHEEQFIEPLNIASET